jgi:hypothetical protein
MKHRVCNRNLSGKVIVRVEITILARNDFPSQSTPFHLLLKDQTSYQRGGSEWEPIKIFSKEMTSPTR